jgi:hypothetical protein
MSTKLSEERQTCEKNLGDEKKNINVNDKIFNIKRANYLVYSKTGI